MRRRNGLWVNLAVAVVKPLLLALTHRDWRGRRNIPAQGGVVVCSNHISYADPLALAHYVYDSGRVPRFLAKASLFSLPVVGHILRGTGQIPVHRNSPDATKALAAAVRAVNAGECVCVYPEGTIPADAGVWPTAGKTGAARIALATGVPVVPLAQWGAHELLPRGSWRPRLLRRTTVRVSAGRPVDLTDLCGADPGAELLREATDRIMDAVTALLVELRREDLPPAQRHGARPGVATAGPDTAVRPSRTETVDGAGA